MAEQGMSVICPSCRGYKASGSSLCHHCAQRTEGARKVKQFFRRPGGFPCRGCGKKTWARLGYCTNCMQTNPQGSCPICQDTMSVKGKRCRKCSCNTDTWKEKQRKARCGKKQTESQRQKNRECHLGLTLSEEAKRHISIATSGINNPMFGRSHSKETRAKMAIRKIGRPLGHQSAEHRMKIGMRLQGRKLSSERIEKMSGANSALWRGGGSQEHYGTEFNGVLHRQIRDRDDHLCQMPGCYLPEHGVKHDVHHIDYIKKHNKSVNLITLCHKCHTKTNVKNRNEWTIYFQEIQKLRGIDHAGM